MKLLKLVRNKGKQRMYKGKSNIAINLNIMPEQLYEILITLLTLFQTYEADADASEVSMHRTINFVVKQMQTKAVYI